MRWLRTFLCLGLLVLPLQVTGLMTARAAVVDLDHTECTAGGTLTTSQGPFGTVSFTIILTMSCVGLLDDDAGFWQLSIYGQQNPGFCAGGHGLGNVNGVSPEGNVSGGVQVTSSATSVQMEGAWSNTGDSSGEAFKASLAAVPQSGIPCQDANTSETLTGEASVTDEPPPQDFVACTLTGAETYSGITAIPQAVTINGDYGAQCINPQSDDAGAWEFTYSGATVTASCGESLGNLMGFDNVSGPEGGGIGGINHYERVGTMLFMEGAVSDPSGNDIHSFAAWGVVRPSFGNCATAPWTASGLTGSWDMAE